MAGLDPAIHVLGTVELQKAWIPGTKPGMTAVLLSPHPYIFT
jgi:hypothetical protein